AHLAIEFGTPEEAERMLEPGLSGDPAILQAGEAGEDIGALKAAADAKVGDALGRRPGDIPAEEEDPAGAGCQMTGQQVHHGALAGTVGTDNGMHFPLADLQ